MIIKNLATRATGPCIAHRPEIISGRDPDNAIFRQSGNFAPKIKGSIVVMEDGDGQSRGIKIPFLGNQAPSQFDRPVLEIITEREIAEHFEKSVMARRVADIIEIIMLAASTHAFL